MDRREAEALVTVMDTAWPQAQLLDDAGELTMRGDMFARDLGNFDVGTGSQAIDDLRRSCTWHGGPTPAEFLQAIVDVRRNIALRERPALEEGLIQAATSDQTRAIVDGYLRRIGVPEPQVDVMRASRSGDPQARIDAARARALSALEEPPAGEQPRQRRGSSPFYTACGAQAGVHAELIDEVWCCPRCKSPISDGCVPARSTA